MKRVILALCVLALVFLDNALMAQKFTPVEKIPDGKALVYIYRPGSMVGAAVHYTVNANDDKVSEYHLRNKSYLVFYAEPGRYTFWAKVNNTRRAVDLDVEAGKTYYMRGNCCEFIIPELEKAKKEIVKCKLATK